MNQLSTSFKNLKQIVNEPPISAQWFFKAGENAVSNKIKDELDEMNERLNNAAQGAHYAEIYKAAKAFCKLYERLNRKKDTSCV